MTPIFDSKSPFNAPIKIPSAYDIILKYFNFILYFSSELFLTFSKINRQTKRQNMSLYL